MGRIKDSSRTVQIVNIDVDNPAQVDCQPENMVAIAEQLSPDQVLGFAVDHKITQIVQRFAPEMEKEVEVSVIMLENQDVFLQAPLATILSPKDASLSMEKSLRSFEFELQEVSEKSAMIESFRSHLSSISTSSILQYHACLIADELVSNAFKGSSPTAQARSKQPVQVFAGRDSERLVVGCSDGNGDLEVSNLLERIQKCYKAGAHQVMSWGPLGARLGSFFVYDSAQSYYLAVDKGKRTMICAALKFKGGLLMRDSTPKNLHFFER